MRDSAGPRLWATPHTREAKAYAAWTALPHLSGPRERPATPSRSGQLAKSPTGSPTSTRLNSPVSPAAASSTWPRTDRHEHADDAAGIRSALGTRAGDAGRSHALDLVGHAECHFLLGDTGEAVEQTHRAVDAASLAKN